MAASAFYMHRTCDLEIYAKEMRDRWPKNPWAWGWTSSAQLQAGRFHDALETIKVGRRVISPRSRYFLRLLSGEMHARLGLRDFSRAEACSRKFLSEREEQEPRWVLIAALAHQGKLADATIELKIAQTFSPKRITLETVERSLLKSYSSDMVDLELEGVRLAGLE
jgi:predicted Zn-dependent protease